MGLYANFLMLHSICLWLKLNQNLILDQIMELLAIIVMKEVKFFVEILV